MVVCDEVLETGQTSAGATRELEVWKLLKRYFQLHYSKVFVWLQRSAEFHSAVDSSEVNKNNYEIYLFFIQKKKVWSLLFRCIIILIIVDVLHLDNFIMIWYLFIDYNLGKNISNWNMKSQNLSLTSILSQCWKSII